jgi:ankyrin repeat protein
MKLLKVLLAVMVLGFSFNAMAARALTDDESVEFTDAIGRGDMKLVKKYVESGVDVNVGYFAWPPLLMAAAKGQLPLVKYFVEHGAKLDYQHPMTQWTAFYHAAYDGDEKMTQYLADKGANINIRAKGDVSVLRLLRDMDNTKMVDFLVKMGVKDEGCLEQKCF